MRYRHRKNISKAKKVVQAVTQLDEGPWRWNLGLEAGLATGISILLFLIIGHFSLGTLTSLGALALLYGNKRPIAERLHIIVYVGLGLAVTSYLSIICSAYEWLSFSFLIVITALACIVTMGTKLGPPGAVIFVLVAAISSRLAIQTAQSPFLIPLFIAAGTAIAWLVVLILHVSNRIKKEKHDLPDPPLSPHVSLDREEILTIVRIVAGVAAAVLLSKPLGIIRVHWVIVAVTAILQAGFDRRLTTVRAFQRVLGTVIGVIVFEALHLLQPNAIGILVIVAVLQFTSQVVIARNYVLGLIFITPMALMITMIGQLSESAITARERIIDTLLGAGLAIVVFWIEEIMSKVIITPPKSGS